MAVNASEIQDVRWWTSSSSLQPFWSPVWNAHHTHHCLARACVRGRARACGPLSACLSVCKYVCVSASVYVYTNPHFFSSLRCYASSEGKT